MANEENGDSVIKMTEQELENFVKSPESKTQFIQMIDKIKNNGEMKDSIIF